MDSDTPSGLSVIIALGAIMLVGFCNYRIDCWWKAQKCAETAAMMGVPYTWDVATGCLIKADGQHWVPLGSFRTVGE
jgi:hypothetical protein